MKEQKKNSRKELNEIEISNLLDAEFKTLVIKMLKEHIGDINSIKKTQEEIKVTLTEIKEKLQKMEISNLLDAEFKTLIIRMLKELSEDLNNIKKIQSEMKDTLIEIKDNLQGNNYRVDEAENQINDLEHRQPIGTRRKKNPKK